MSFLTLYLLLLKATLTSFSGLSSVPVIHRDFVVQRQVLTERQLNTAIAAARSGPGPLGLYVVSLGYMVSGVSGALAGFLAMVTPAFLVVPLLRFLKTRSSHPRLRGAINGILLSAAGLLISSTIPIARASIVDALTTVVAIGSFLALAFTRVETLWVIGGAALIGLLSGLLPFVTR